MIYRLRPNRVHRTYKGGGMIDRFCKTTSVVAQEYMPEDWTASVTSCYDSNGKTEGIGVTEDGVALTDIVGNDEYRLLVKLLNSDERLVIQAHPTVEFAKKHLNSNFGKTECWYFLNCREGAYVYIGFKEGATRERWEQAFKEQDTESMTAMLHKVSVNKGDFIFVDGGVPHAIGPGCFMIELQEPSDLMVVAERFTPSGRRIPDRRMDMGLDFKLMMDVYDYTPMSEEQLKTHLMPEPKPVALGVTEILGSEMTDKFKMLKLDGSGKTPVFGKYAVAVCIGGEGELNGTKVSSGDRLCIKDENKIEFSGDESFSVILCF